MLITSEAEIPNSVGVQYQVTNDYLCYAVETLTCFDRAGTRYPLDLPDVQQFWIEDGVIFVLNLEGIWRVDLP